MRCRYMSRTDLEQPVANASLTLLELLSLSAYLM